MCRRFVLGRKHIVTFFLYGEQRVTRSRHVEFKDLRHETVLNQNMEAATNQVGVMKGECSGSLVFLLRGRDIVTDILFSFSGAVSFFALPEKLRSFFTPHSRNPSCYAAPL